MIATTESQRTKSLNRQWIALPILTLLTASTAAAAAFDPYISAYGGGSGHTTRVDEVGRLVLDEYFTTDSHIGNDNLQAFNQPSGGVSGSILGGNYRAFVNVPEGTLKAGARAPIARTTDFDPLGTRELVDSFNAGGASGVASFTDYVTVSGDFSAGRLEFILKAHLEGSFQPSSEISPGFLGDHATFGYSYVDFNVSADGSSDAVNFFETYYPTQGDQSIDRDFEMIVRVDPSSPTQGTFSLSASLGAFTSGGSTADFGNTARFNLILPPGYTQTSGLGFLTAIPEPEHYTLVAAAGLLGLTIWRRSRRPTANG